MAIKTSHNFLTKINGKNISFEKLDYAISGVENRMNYVKKIIEENDEFLQEYFDNYYIANPSNNECLSHNDNICTKLESMATYILSQVSEKSKLQYRFYNGQKNFDNVLKKEYSLDKIIEDGSKNVSNQTDGDIMYFLKREENSWYLPKNVKITQKDFERQDELGQKLREYNEFKENLVKLKNELSLLRCVDGKITKYNTTKLKYMIGAVQNDMLDMKIQYDRPIVFTNTLKASCKNYLEDVDFLNPVHVECFLKLNVSCSDFEDDLSMLLRYFNEILEKVLKKLSYEEKEIIKVVRWGVKSKENVNKCLKIGYENKQISKLIQLKDDELPSLISKVVSMFMIEYSKDMRRYLDFKKENSILFDVVPNKVCKRCGKRKTLSSFVKKKDMKDGYRNECKQCINEGK